MNNGERILRAKEEFASLTGMVSNPNDNFIWQQVKLGSQLIMLSAVRVQQSSDMFHIKEDFFYSVYILSYSLLLSLNCLFYSR